MKRLYIELADTSLKREMGLMGRKILSNNHGMLFKFPHQRRLSFWMQNTYIPLQIAFLDDNGKVLQIEEMIPLNTRAIQSRSECRYALEVNKGWFDNNNVFVGTVISGLGFKNLKKEAQYEEELDLEEYGLEEGGEFDLPVVEFAPEPEVVLEKSVRDMIEKAFDNGKKLIIIYQKKDGYTLPPKTISNPHYFDVDEHGNPEAICRAWDEQDVQWKSFLVNNIIDIQEKPE